VRWVHCSKNPKSNWGTLLSQRVGPALGPQDAQEPRESLGALLCTRVAFFSRALRRPYSTRQSDSRTLVGLRVRLALPSQGSRRIGQPCSPWPGPDALAINSDPAKGHPGATWGHPRRSGPLMVGRCTHERAASTSFRWGAKRNPSGLRRRGPRASQ